MTTDLTGGIDPSREYLFAERPDNPEMRDSVSFWVVDDRCEVGLPRIGVEAVADNWDNHEIQVNVAFPDEGPEHVVRQGILSCSAYDPSCMFMMMLPADASTYSRVGTPIHAGETKIIHLPHE